MPLFDILILACWVVFAAYWLVSAFTAKRNLKNGAWWYGVYFRLATAVVIFILLKAGSYTSFHFVNFIPKNPVINGIGVILAAGGIAFAMWARVHLGRNWGMPMSLKENPELVTTGPYAFVRHPIYTGVLTAMLGSSFVAGLWWLVFFVFFFVYFFFAARTEEKVMIAEFPHEYPAYKARTKMLIPFVL